MAGAGGPLSLGYWLVQRGVTLCADPSREYRGIDRAPLLPGPDEDWSLFAGPRHRLLKIRNRYWAMDDIGHLHRDASAALELRAAFEEEGIALDVVLAEFVEHPDLTGVPADLCVRFHQNLPRWTTAIGHPSGIRVVRLGIDVAYPFPSFHSAIGQPNLQSVWPGYASELNEHGLFTAPELAKRAAVLCNRTDTSWRPFCCLAIHRLES